MLFFTGSASSHHYNVTSILYVPRALCVDCYGAADTPVAWCGPNVHVGNSRQELNTNSRLVCGRMPELKCTRAWPNLLSDLPQHRHFMGSSSVQRRLRML